MTEDSNQINTEGESEAIGNVPPLARPSEVLPSILHLLPLVNRPFFPGQAIPLVVDREPWLRTIEGAAETAHKLIGLVLTRSDNSSAAGPDDLYSMGTAGRIHRVVQFQDKLQLYVEGLQRFRVEDWISREKPFVVRARYYPETAYQDVPELKAYSVAIINTIKELLPLNPMYGEELKLFFSRFGPNEPSRLADFAASLTTAGK